MNEQGMFVIVISPLQLMFREKGGGFNSHVVFNYFRYVSGLNCSPNMYLSSLAATTGYCVIREWMLFVNGSESKRSKLSQPQFCAHVAVKEISSHLWLLDRLEHLHESGFGLTCMDVFPLVVFQKPNCANSRSCSLTVHCTPHC